MSTNDDRHTEHQIARLEEQLRLAMLTSNVAELDALISPDLIFTTFTGQRLASKQADLDAHRSGAIQFQRLEPLESQIKVYGDTAIVSVCMAISSLYQGAPSQGKFRFTRVWHHSDLSGWQIIAGHVGAVQD